MSSFREFLDGVLQGLGFPQKTSSRRKNSQQRNTRSLHLEPLESRELLAVAPPELHTNVWIEKLQDADENGQTGIFRVYRDDTRSALTVGYQLDGGTATLGSDYSSSFFYLPGFDTATKKGSLSFSAGTASMDITIVPVDDTLIEGTETVIFSLSPYSGTLYTVDESRQTATLDIIDNDIAPNVWIEKIQDADENGQSGIFRVYRDDTRNALTVGYEWDGGTATLGSDYSSYSYYLSGFDMATKKGSLTFSAGSASVDITIYPTDDSLIEETETVTFSLSPPSGTHYTVDESRQTATLDIFDNDVAPKVWIEKIQNAAEGGQNGIFRMHRDDTRNTLTVGYQLDGGTATLDTDYYSYYLPGFNATTKNGMVSFGAGTTYVDITVYSLDDTLVEETETVILSLSPYFGPLYTVDETRQTATLNIIDNDVAPKVWIERVRDADATGTQTGIFRIYRDNAAVPLTIGYELLEGTALPGIDFQANLPGFNAATNKGTLTFAANVFYVDIPIALLGPVNVEEPKTVTIALASPADGNTSYTLDAPRQTATLEIPGDILAKPTVWIERLKDAAEGGPSGVFRLYRDDTRSSLTVGYEWVGGTATLGSDYSSSTYYLPGFNTTTKKGTVTFAVGKPYVDLTIFPMDDVLIEGTETVTFALSPSAGTLYTIDENRNTATLDILDNDVAPNVWIERIRDAAEGGQTGIFRIYRDDVRNALSVGYEWSGGTATLGTDYSSTTSYLPGFNATTKSGMVSFAAGKSYVDITINPIDDPLIEGTETVVFALSPASGTHYTVDENRREATLSIFDNDVAPNVWIERIRDAAEGGQTGIFRVYRNDVRNALTVGYEWAGGTATLGTDYSSSASYLPGFNATTKSGTVSFAAGKSYVDITINPLEDTLIEGTETVTFALSPASGSHYTVDENRQAATLAIFDNDIAPTVWIERVQDAVEAERQGGFRICRDDVRNALTVDYEWAGGTATLGTDYSSTTTYLPGFNATTKKGTVSFAAGKSYVDLKINPIDDGLIEETETVIFALSPYSGTSYVIDENRQTATLDIYDDVRWTVGVEKVADGAERTAEEEQQPGRFKISRAHGVALDEPLTIGFTLSGTATYGEDYVSVPARQSNWGYFWEVTIPAGETFAYVDVNVIDDFEYEPTETVILTLDTSSAYNLNAAAKSVTVNILDNDVKSNISVEKISDAAETAAGETPRPGRFRITRENGTALDLPLTIGFSLSGTANCEGGLSAAPDCRTNPASQFAWGKGIVGSVTIPAGETFAYVDVEVIDNFAFDGTRTVILTLDSSSGYNLAAGRGSATVNIVDNDVKWDVSVEKISDAAERESWEEPQPGRFKISRANGTGLDRPLTINYTLTGTATCENGLSSSPDYRTNPASWFSWGNGIVGSVTIPAGELFAYIDVEVIDDFEYESDETVILTLNSSSIYNLNDATKSATVVIFENDVKWDVSVVADDPTASEVANGRTIDPGRFTITRANGSGIERPLTVAFKLTGTAGYGSDYTTWPECRWVSGSGYVGSVTIPAGETFAYVDVDVIDDLLFESDETVILTLDTSSNYNLVASAKAATVTILDNDVKWDVKVEKISDGAERTEAETPQPGRFKISRANGTGIDQPMTVSFKLSGTAGYGVDYTTSPASTYSSGSGGYVGSVTIPAEAAFTYVDVNVIDDFLFESDETVILTLNSSSNYNLPDATKSATVTIFDNDVKWNVKVEKISDGAETETGEEPQPGRFKITRENGSGLDRPLTVSFKLTGTAGYGVDYTTSPASASSSGLGYTGSVTIPVGETFAYVDVNVIDDTLVELTETVILTLDTASGYNLDAAAKTATVRIFDNEVKWHVRVEADDPTAAETTESEEPNPGRFKIVRESGADLAQPLTVSFRISGTADYGSDYTTTPACFPTAEGDVFGSITIPAGETFAYIDVNAIDDLLFEGNETVILTLEPRPGYLTEAATNSAVVTILDNECWTVELETIAANGWETAPGLMARPIVFRFSRSGLEDTARPLTVWYSLDGTAEYGSDYALPEGEGWGYDLAEGRGYVVIPAGALFVDLTFAILDDELVEPEETVLLTILDEISDTDIGYVSGERNTAAASIFDNDGEMQIDPGGPYTVGEGSTIVLAASRLRDPFDAGEWSWSWDLDGDGMFERSGPETVFSAEGLSGPLVKTVAVKAVDPEGHEAITFAEVRIVNVAPTIALDGPATGDLNAMLAWSGSFVDPGDDTWTATVNFGDATPTEAVALSPDRTFAFEHAYTIAGVYTVTVVIDDGTDSTVLTRRVAVGVPAEDVSDDPETGVPGLDGPVLPEAVAPDLEAIRAEPTIPVILSAGLVVPGGGSGGTTLWEGSDQYVTDGTAWRGTLLPQDDGSTRYQAPDGFRGIDFVNYRTTDLDENAFDSGLIPILVRPDSLEGYETVPLPSGFRSNPMSTDFGEISVLGQNHEVGTFGVFTPGTIGNYRSYLDETRVVTRSITTYDGEAKLLHGSETLTIEIVCTDLGNGDWIYSEIASYSYDFLDEGDVYKGGYTYAFGASLKEGVYESIFVLTSTDIYRVVREYDESSSDSSVHWTVTEQGTLKNSITINQRILLDEQEAFMSDARGNCSIVTRHGSGTYTRPIEGGSVAGELAMAAQSVASGQAYVEMIDSGDGAGWSTSGLASSSLLEQEQKGYKGGGSFSLASQSGNAASSTSGDLMEYGFESNTLSLAVAGALLDGEWVWSGTGGTSGFTDDAVFIAAEGTFSDSGGTPGNAWSRSGSTLSFVTQQDHTDYGTVLLYTDGGWAVTFGMQTVSGTSREKNEYDYSGHYEKSGSSDGYSWDGSGRMNGAGADEEFSWYMVVSEWDRYNWSTSGNAGLLGSGSSRSAYDGDGTYTANYTQGAAEYAISGTTTESGNDRSALGYVLSSVLSDDGSWSTSGTARESGATHDESSYNGSGSFKMAIADERLVGNTKYEGTASQSGENSSGSRWNSGWVFVSGSWRLEEGTGNATETGSSRHEFEGRAETKEAWPKEPSVTQFQSESSRHVKGKGSDSFNTELDFAVVAGAWQTVDGRGDSEGSSEFDSDYTSKGTYATNASTHSVQGTLKANGATKTRSNYKFDLFWNAGAWEAEGDMYDFLSENDHYQSSNTEDLTAPPKEEGVEPPPEEEGVEPPPEEDVESPPAKPLSGRFTLDLSFATTTNIIHGEITESAKSDSEYEIEIKAKRHRDGTDTLEEGHSIDKRSQHSRVLWEDDHEMATDADGKEVRIAANQATTRLDGGSYTGPSTYRSENKSDFDFNERQDVKDHKWTLTSGQYTKDELQSLETSREGDGTLVKNGITYVIRGEHTMNNRTQLHREGEVKAFVLEGGKTEKRWDEKGNGFHHDDSRDFFGAKFETEKKHIRSITQGYVYGTSMEEEHETTTSRTDIDYQFNVEKNDWDIVRGDAEATYEFAYEQSYKGSSKQPNEESDEQPNDGSGEQPDEESHGYNYYDNTDNKVHIVGDIEESSSLSIKTEDVRTTMTYDTAAKDWKTVENKGKLITEDKVHFSDIGSGEFKEHDEGENENEEQERKGLTIETKNVSTFDNTWTDTLDLATEGHEYKLVTNCTYEYMRKDAGVSYAGMVGKYDYLDDETFTVDVNLTVLVDKEGNVTEDAAACRKTGYSSKLNETFELTVPTRNYDTYKLEKLYSLSLETTEGCVVFKQGDFYIPNETVTADDPQWQLLIGYSEMSLTDNLTHSKKTVTTGVPHSINNNSNYQTVGTITDEKKYNHTTTLEKEGFAWFGEWTITGNGKETLSDSHDWKFEGTKHEDTLINGTRTRVGDESRSTQVEYVYHYTWNQDRKKWVIAVDNDENGNPKKTKGSTTASKAYKWSDITKTQTVTDNPGGSITTVTVIDKIADFHNESVTVDYSWDPATKKWEHPIIRPNGSSDVGLRGNGGYTTEKTTIAVTTGPGSVHFDSSGFPKGVYPYDVDEVGNTPTSAGISVTATSISVASQTHHEAWAVRYLVRNNEVVRLTSGAVIDERLSTTDSTAVGGYVDKGERHDPEPDREADHYGSLIIDKDCLCHAGRYDFQQVDMEWENKWSYTDEQHSQERATVVTEWRLDYNPNGEPIYSSSTTAERYGKKNGEFSYVIDNHTSGTSVHWGVDPTTHKLGGKLFTDSLDSSYHHSASGSYDYEQTVTGRAAAGSTYYTTTSVLGEESGGIQNSLNTAGVSNGTRFLYQTDHEHTSYSNGSGDGRSFELTWSGVPTAWSGVPTAWAGERVTRSWHLDAQGETIETTTVEPMPDPGWPYYHPHEEWPARPYHGGTPYVMAPAPPASQTIATAHVPDGPTRLDIPGSGYSKPGQKYRPGDNEFRNYNIVLPNGVIVTPEQNPDRTFPERTWTEWAGQWINDAIENPLDTTQTILDVAGFIPVVGIFADVTNGGIHLWRGNWLDAGMSFVAAIPVYGDGIQVAYKGGKLAGKAIDTIHDVSKAGHVLKESGHIADVGKLLGKTGKAEAKALCREGKAVMAAQKQEAGLARRALQEGGGCFTEGTQIVVGMGYDEDGNVLYDTKNIEDIAVGDLVYSYNTLTGELEQSAVTATYKLESDHIDYLTFVDEDGNEQVIETTDVHPFWVVTDEPDLSRAARSVVDENGNILYHDNIAPGLNGYWVEAKDLRVGDLALGANGRLSTLQGVLRVEVEGGIAVFNFMVEGNHDYFVLSKDFGLGQSCVLVHNALCYQGAAKALKDGLKFNKKSIEIVVKDRNTASELLFRNFQHKGYTNTTGWSFSGLKQLGSKLKTYHWDEILDAAGRVLGHGPNNPHAHMKHLQIITEKLQKITIYFN